MDQQAIFLHTDIEANLDLDYLDLRFCPVKKHQHNSKVQEQVVNNSPKFPGNLDT